MAKKLSVELKTLNDIFEDNFFEIPDYQRGYSWEIQQVRDLIEDIEKLLEKDISEYKHFTGTIVAACKQNKPNIFEIVDGQQRLTTLVIFINAIIESNSVKFNYLDNFYLKRGEIGNETLVLKPNLETFAFYNNYIINNKTRETPELKSHINIKNAKIEFDKWLKKNNRKTDKIVNIITKGLGFIFYNPLSHKEIGIMFEVINNRGKLLSELEKVKNYFIYISIIYNKITLRDTINRNWTDILKYLNNAEKTSNEEENAFLRNCYLTFFKPDKSEYDIYERLKEIYPSNLFDNNEIDKNCESINNFIEFLKDSSFNYAYFFNNKFFDLNYKDEYKYNLGKAIKYLRCQGVEASIMPLYLAIMSNKKDIKKNYKLLQILEKLNFRVYILPSITKRADSKQADLFYLANKYYKQKSPTINHKWLAKELVDFTKILCDEKKFTKALKIEQDDNYDFKDWKGLRYFLARYEEKRRNEDNSSWDVEKILDSRKDPSIKTNDYLSIEHIWAKENRVKDFQHNYIEKRRLGNFILLSLGKNISLKDIDIPEKIDKINELIASGKLFDLYQLCEFKDEIYNNALVNIDAKNRRWSKNFYRDLSIEINKLREDKFLKFAWETWRFSKNNIIRD